MAILTIHWQTCKLICDVDFCTFSISDQFKINFKFNLEALSKVSIDSAVQACYCNCNCKLSTLTIIYNITDKTGPTLSVGTSTATIKIRYAYQIESAPFKIERKVHVFI